MYYAQFNSFGSDTDVGFSNTWQVVSFGNKSARDAWVKMNADRRDIAAISRSEALKMAGAYQRLCTVKADTWLTSTTSRTTTRRSIGLSDEPPTRRVRGGLVRPALAI